MDTFSGFVLKHKKTVFSLVLFSVLAGILIPIKTANALIPSGGAGLAVGLTVAGALAGGAAEGVSGFLSSITRDIIVGMAFLTDTIVTALAEWSSGLFTWVIGTMVNEDKWAITRATVASGPTIGGAVFYGAWNIVKNWANIVIVIGFLGVALAFILSIDKYKKLLVPLLITALLVNFSVVFVGFFIDLSNIAIKTFTVGTDKEAGLVYQVNAAWNNIVKDRPTDTMGEVLEFAFLSSIFNFVYLAIAAVMFYFSIVFIIRYLVLAILFIMSPLAFVLRIFPVDSIRGLWTKWWQQFVKWCFIGLAGAFVLNLSTQILNSNTALIDGKSVKDVAPFTTMVFYMFIVLAFLVVGLVITLKSAMPIAKMLLGAITAAVMAVITGGGSLLSTAGGTALKMMGKATGTTGKATEAGRNIKDTFSNLYHGTREGLGLAKRGTLATIKQKRNEARLKEPMERLKNISNDEKGNAELAEKATKGGTSAERAAAFNILRERKEIYRINPSDRKRVLENAQAYDNQLKPNQLAEEDHTWAVLDESSKKGFRQQEIARNPKQPGESEADYAQRIEGITNRRAQEYYLRQKLPEMGFKQMISIDPSLITPGLVAGHYTAGMVSRYQAAGSRQINNVLDSVPEVGQELKKAHADNNKSEIDRLTGVLRAMESLAQTTQEPAEASRIINKINRVRSSMPRRGRRGRRRGGGAGPTGGTPPTTPPPTSPPGGTPPTTPPPTSPPGGPPPTTPPGGTSPPTPPFAGGGTPYASPPPPPPPPPEPEPPDSGGEGGRGEAPTGGGLGPALAAFNPKEELQRIRQLKREERRPALEQFKKKLAEQRHNLANFQVSLENQIEKNPDTPKEELLKTIESSSNYYGFSDEQKRTAQDLVNNFYQRRQQVLNLRNKYQNNLEGNRQLIKELTGGDLTPTEMANVKLTTGPMNFNIETDNKTTAKLFENAGGGSMATYGFASGGSKGAGIGYTVINKELTKLHGEKTEKTQRHEIQHIKNNLFRELFEKNLSNVEKFAKEGGSENYLRYKQEMGLSRVKDEILATLHTRELNEINPKEMFLTKDSAYDYFRGTRDSYEYKSNPKLADQILKKEYGEFVERGTGALKKLVASGKSKEEAIALLTDKPLKSWPKVVNRLLGQK